MCFLKTLAGFLKSDVNAALPFARASTHVWLPTNRSVISLKESLLNQKTSAIHSFVLPTLHSLTDLESENPFALKAIDDLPKAVGSFERLAMVMDFLPATLHVKKAFAIAEYLITLHDECIIGDVSVELLESQYDAKLFDAAPAHVQDAFQNLRILTHHLPNALTKRGLVTESWRRQQAMRILAAEITQNPPAHPILIAGTTGTVPATRALLKAVYDLPNGIVVLPGLEGDFDPIRVSNMRSHPQHTLFDLCQYLDVDPTDVPALGADDAFSNDRRRDVELLFKMPPFERKDVSEAVPALIECASQAEEARVITAIVREKLFETKHSIAIVTPNQTLMRRLRTELSLHGITANDSAGIHLKDTPVGSFLINFATFMQNPSCATFIHLAKHPLCAKSNRGEHLASLRKYEVLLRKKQKPWDTGVECDDQSRLSSSVFDEIPGSSPGMTEGVLPSSLAVSSPSPAVTGGALPSSLPASSPSSAVTEGVLPSSLPASSPSSAVTGGALPSGLAVSSPSSAVTEGVLPSSLPASSPSSAVTGGALPSGLAVSSPSPAVSSPGLTRGSSLNLFITQLKAILQHRTECRSFYEFIRFFKNAADEIATGTLFKNNDGESASAFFDALIKTPPFIRRDFEDAVLTLMAMAPVVHTYEGLGSRVRILGTLEARLNTADVVICASLNEGNWPKTPENDPILSDSFRLSVGLPSQKRRQGLAAHDFCTSFYAPYLYITRPIREGGEAALQSRLWTRLVGRYGISDSPYQMLANYQLASTAEPLQPPMPMPLKMNRPKVYYASHVEQLMRDPYAYYARYILRLDPLPALDEALSAKDKGQVFHDVLDQYIKTEPEPSFEKLLSFSKPFFDAFEEKGRGVVKTFWWYRFKRIAQWWHDKLDAEPSLNRATEANGEMTLFLAGTAVALKSRADRIESPLEGAVLRIIDYKTGTLPTRKSVADGTSPQLLVEAVIAHNQGFGDSFPADGAFQLEYWRLTGGEPAGECLTFTLSFDDRLKTEASIIRVLTYFLSESNPYLAAGLYADSRFFARMEEWEMGVN